MKGLAPGSPKHNRTNANVKSQEWADTSTKNHGGFSREISICLRCDVTAKQTNAISSGIHDALSKERYGPDHIWFLKSHDLRILMNGNKRIEPRERQKSTSEIWKIWAVLDPPSKDLLCD